MATILIIDDSPGNRASLGAALRDAGHEVLEAGNGREGVALAREHLPDLCLVDDVMPELNGVKTIKALAEDARTAGIRCVFMMSSEDATQRAWATRAGAVECLVGTVDVERVSKLASHDGAGPSAVPVVEDDAAWEATVVASGRPVLVAFLARGAMWRETHEELARLADEAKDALVVVATDVDRFPTASRLAAEHGLRGLPAFAVLLDQGGGRKLVSPMSLADVRNMVLSRPRF
jgi:twitching motility two-component system response regulator PilH